MRGFEGYKERPPTGKYRENKGRNGGVESGPEFSHCDAKENGHSSAFLLHAIGKIGQLGMAGDISRENSPGFTEDQRNGVPVLGVNLIVWGFRDSLGEEGGKREGKLASGEGIHSSRG